MATYSLKLGSYTFPSTFHPSSTPSDTRLGVVEVPRRDGVVVGTPTLKEKIVNVKGMLRADTPTALRTAMDSLLAAVNGDRQKLYLWDDRYIWANKIAFATDYDETSFKRYCFVSIDFLCDKALWEAETESTDTWSSPSHGATHGIVVGGNAPAEPVFEITVGATGNLDVELALPDGSFSLTGQVTSGDVLVVDCAEETVTLDVDDSDYMSQFDLVFLELSGGATNTLTFSNTGVAVSQIVTTWRDRWY